MKQFGVLADKQLQGWYDDRESANRAAGDFASRAYMQTAAGVEVCIIEVLATATAVSRVEIVEYEPPKGDVKDDGGRVKG